MGQVWGHSQRSHLQVLHSRLNGLVDLQVPGEVGLDDSCDPAMKPLWEGGQQEPGSKLESSPVPPLSHPCPRSALCPPPTSQAPSAARALSSYTCPALTTPRPRPRLPPAAPELCQPGLSACLLCLVLQLAQVSTDENNVQTSPRELQEIYLFNH